MFKTSNLNVNEIGLERVLKYHFVWQIMQFLETQGFLDYLERCNTAEENAHNLLDKLQDATGRGQNPLTIFPSQVSDPEIITIANPEIEGSSTDSFFIIMHLFSPFIL